MCKKNSISFLLLLSIVLTSFSSGCVRQKASPSNSMVDGPAIFLFTRLDSDQPHLHVFIINPIETPLFLNPGRYYCEALYPNDSVFAFPVIEILENDQGISSFTPSQFTFYPLSGSDSQQEIETLTLFLMAVDTVRLTYYEIASGGYQYPLFDSSVPTSWEDANRLLESFADLGDETQIVKAARNFTTRALSNANSVGRKGLARPTSGPLDIIKSIAGFFGIIKDEEETARQNLIKVLSSKKSTTEEEELLEIIQQTYPLESSISDFIRKLENSEVNRLAELRQELLQNSSVFYGIWQDQNPKSNRPDGEVIHRVGADAVTRGAELNVNIIKEVLGSVFPGMDQGFEYADKVNKFSEFVRDLYQDPLSAMGGAVRGQIEDNIKEQIKTQFIDLFPDIEESEVETLTNDLVDQITQIIASQEEMQQDLLSENENENDSKPPQISKTPVNSSLVALDTETFTENGQTYRFFEARGSRCDEAEGTFIYRWSLDLMQEVDRDLVMGTIKFHNCPQGGRVLYRVEGFVDDEGLFSMVGVRKDGGGELFDNSSPSVTFTFDPTSGLLTPNYAP